jgi:hypothetical protein
VYTVYFYNLVLIMLGYGRFLKNYCYIISSDPIDWISLNVFLHQNNYLFLENVKMSLFFLHRQAQRRNTSRSQWRCGPRNELSLHAQITLEAWMSVCVHSVYVGSCVCSGFAMGWSPINEVLPTVYKIKKLKWNSISQIPHALEGAKGIYNIKKIIIII